MDHIQPGDDQNLSENSTYHYIIISLGSKSPHIQMKLSTHHRTMWTLLKLPDHPSYFSVYYAQKGASGTETRLQMEIEER